MPAACSASPSPRVKLLNIGTEELKGTDELKDAAALLREADYLPLQLRRLHRGRPAVARRGRRRRHRRLLRQYRAEDRRGHRALRHRPAAPRLHQLAPLEGRLPALAAGAEPAARSISIPNNHNGAVFLGLNGLVVKSHGGANAKGVANAIRVAASMVRNDITRKIGDDLDNFRAHAFADEAARVSRRSVVAGVGSALPQAAGHQRRARRRPSTPPTNGSSSAPASAAATSPATARRPATPGDRGRARGARRTPASTPREIDLIVLATATPDQTFPSTATKVQAALGIDDCIAFDVARGLHRLPLRAVGRRYRCSARGMRRQGAGDRRRDVQPDPRLGGPRDLRPVRRRRRRGGAQRRGDATAASSRPGSTPTGATTICSSSTAAPRPPARSASCG